MYVIARQNKWKCEMLLFSVVFPHRMQISYQRIYRLLV
jgi:hypothetical protein